MNHALKMGKTALTWAVVGLTIAWSVGLSAFVLPSVAKAADCPTLAAGDLFKVTGISAVYLLNANMQRLYFPNSAVYASWYHNADGSSDYSGVIEMDPSCIINYPQPSSFPAGVNYHSGTRLVKVQVHPDVYAVEPGNKLSKVGSEAVAAALYGSNWGTKVVDINDAWWPNYVSRGSDITESKPHDGQLIKVGATGQVYYVTGGNRVAVDGSVLSTDVREVSQAVADTVPMGSGTTSASSVYSNPAQGVGTSSGSGATSPTTPPAAAGTLTVALASDTPANSYALASAARVPFTKLNFTAGNAAVTITSLKVVRGGTPAVNGDFATINMIDASGNLLNDAGKTLNSDNQATFTEDIVVPANTTKTYTIVGDMAAAAAMTNGNVPTLGIYSLETTASVVGSLPLYGNSVTTNENITLGTFTAAEGSTLSTVTKRVGDTNVDLASLKMTASAENFQLERVMLYNSSSTADADLNNFKLKYNNNAVVNGTMKDKYLTFDLTSCTTDCKLEKGQDRTYTVTGDIVGGSGRSINLDVQKAVHVLARDLKNNVYVTITNSASTMNNSVEISQGTLNVTKSNDLAAGNIPENSSGIELAKFNFKVTGEPIDIRTLVYRVSTTGTVGPNDLTSITLYNAAGKALTGNVDVNSTHTASPGYASSTDSFTLQPGDNVLTVKGKLNADPATGDTIRIDVDMNTATNFDAVGVNTGDTITVGTYATPQSYVTGPVMTIETASLRITQLPTATSTYAAGVGDVVVAEVNLDASGSAEDLRVTQFKIIDYTDSGAKAIDIQNIRLFVDMDGDDNNGSGTRVALAEVKNGTNSTANTDETFTFNLSGADQFTIKKGKTVRVVVKGNITGGAATGKHIFRTNVANDVTAVGVSTGNTVTETVDTAPQGHSTTVGAAGGTVEVTIDTSNPDAAQYAAGTNGVTLATYNFYASTTEDVELDYIYVTQRNTDTTSAAFQDYRRLYFVNEAGTEVVSMVPTSTKPLLDFGDNAFVIDTADTDGAKLYLKADLAYVQPETNVTVGGHMLGFNIAAAGDVVAKGDLTGTGSVEYFGTATPSGNTHRMYKGTPTIESLALGSSTLSNGSVDMYKFRVTANTADVGLYKFTFDITTTSVTLTQLELYDITSSQETLLYSSSTIAWAANATIAEVYLDDDEPSAIGPPYQGEERTVAVGIPRTYVLRGTFTGASSGDSVSTRMAGDSAGHENTTYIAGMATLTTSTAMVDTDRHDDFIWTDRHAQGHATTTADWANGYLVSGLSSASTSARTLSL